MKKSLHIQRYGHTTREKCRWMIPLISTREGNWVRRSQDFLPRVIRSSFTSAVVNCLQRGCSLIRYFWGPRWRKWPKVSLCCFFLMTQRDKKKKKKVNWIWFMSTSTRWIKYFSTSHVFLVSFLSFRFKILSIAEGRGAGCWEALDFYSCGQGLHRRSSSWV